MGYGCGYELVFVPADLGQFIAQLRPTLPLLPSASIHNDGEEQCDIFLPKALIIPIVLVLAVAVPSAAFAQYNGYRLGKELGINYRVCLFHLKKLEDAELIEGKLGITDNVATKTYHLTSKGKQMLSAISKVS